MALTVTVNQFASSNVRAVHRKQAKSPPPPHPNSTSLKQVESAATPHSHSPDLRHGRRALILSAAAAAPQLSDSGNELLKKYLKKSEENKAKNDKERMENYYKRNYKDYFEFVEGTIKGKSEEQLTESEKGILDWLKANK
ncbi:Photosystem I PsaN, reaction centre subunit N [Corchorus olitorius]|uniref:Photosystem I PsaN, reaction centre subunit N n=1 Tax=Corchorus olitorius TaxID=93759 RepID=A0A1R3GZ40_9ROSI|nr:Photosystem I PsaN, reaction centre subunit N [Corchorus olitorius]